MISVLRFRCSPTRLPLMMRVMGVGLGLALSSIACGGNKPEGADPIIPSDVVQAYVARLSAGDRDKAAHLLTATERANGGSPIGTGRITRFGMRPPTPVEDKMSNGRRVADAVSIWIDFTRVDETDITLVNGRASWNFILVKERPGDPWLIDDQGLG